MTGCDTVHAKLVHAAVQLFKLQAAVALNTWIRCPSGLIVGNKRFDDGLVKLIRKIKDIIRHTEPFGNRAGIFHIF